MEIRKAPNDTAALSFVANSEAARYVFVVVAAADVMIAGRRYDTFVLACGAPDFLSCSLIDDALESRRAHRARLMGAAETRLPPNL